MTLDDLILPWPDLAPPAIDRPGWRHGRNKMVNHYAKHGWVVIEDVLPDDLIDAYCDEWRAHSPDVGGYPDPVPYMAQPAMLELCMHGALHDAMTALVGEPVGLHLNLSGWRSTTRNWHQDGYLNPDSNMDYYVAAWMALDDVHPDAGPFEYVSGSHRIFGPIRNQLMLEALTPEERTSPLWPTYSERILTPLFEEQIAEHGLKVEQFIAKKGDVLLWHPRLLHRGSVPVDPELERRALISHYSGIGHRPDFPTAKQHGGGWYFPIVR